jgi:hypothetical protein
LFAGKLFRDISCVYDVPIVGNDGQPTRERLMNQCCSFLWGIFSNFTFDLLIHVMLEEIPEPGTTAAIPLQLYHKRRKCFEYVFEEKKRLCQIQ